MSVVGSDFEELKQFNLAEIYDPTPKPDAEESKRAKADEEAKGVQRRANTSSPEPEVEQVKDIIPNHLASEGKESTPTTVD